MAEDDRGQRPPRERRSWRDIDNARERGGQRSGPGTQRGSDEPSAAASRSYRAQLEKLFDKGEAAKLLGDRAARGAPSAGSGGSGGAGQSPSGGAAGAAGKEGESKLALMRAVKSAVGREAITAAVDALLARYPLPDDIEVLEQVLEHTDKKNVQAALQKLMKMLERVRPKRARTMLARLRTIEEISGDAELAQLAVKVRDKLLA
jgi:hypothetical protein